MQDVLINKQGGSMKKFAFLLLIVFISQSALAEESKHLNNKNEQIKPALLVIDVQNEYLPFMSEAEKPLAFRMINGCIWLFRQKELPIIRIYNTHPQWGPKTDSEAFAFPSSIMVTEDDAKIIKNYPSAFRMTDLDSMLKKEGCNTLFLCGLSATACVLATYHGAAERGYNVFMVKDAIMSPNRNQTKVIEDISDSVSFQTIMFMLDH
jgi:nicotinamidase-related amidase